MFISCKKTGEEYEITDREIGEKVECPCCGEKFVVDDLIISDAAYTAALIRKTEAVMLRNEPMQALYKHGTESSAALLFDRAYEYRDAEAQFQLAKWLFDNERAYPLAAFWFECAAAKKHPEATYRFAECLWNGIGVRKNIDRAVEEYRNAAKYGCDAAKDKVVKFDFAEYAGYDDGGGKATFTSVQKMIGDAKKFEQYLCAKYNARGVMLFWSDDALPEWGTPKGSSIIIGSFKSEKDVPREMLDEILHLIGRSLSYTGRYVDNRVADEEKFLFCYAVYPTDEEHDAEIDSAGADDISHISLLLQRKLDDESGESKRRAITWRETVDMNCPLCEEKITLPTRLIGSQVRCSHCKGEFVAKGEGIMTTAERKDFREYRKWSEEANDIEQNCMRPEGCIVSALRLGFNMEKYYIEPISIGSGYGHPWPGVYVVMQFTDEDDSRRVNACKTLEFGLGFWARWTKTECAYDKFSYTFYIRKNRPCEQNVHAKIEIEERKLKIEQQMKAQSAEQANASISAREAEYERLKYLIYGESELTNNYFDFQQYMYDRYHVAVVNVFNDRADDPFCKSFGFKDGFGIVVDTREALKGEQFAMLVSDLEKRICRKVTLVKKGFLGDVFKYCFVPSMPDQSARQSEKPVGSQIAARTRNERSVTMKRTATTLVPQHLGNGSGVDWSRENKAFSEMLVKHGIKKFHAEMANPYCAEVSIPMTEKEDVVRDFANDLFHALDILDEGYDLEFGQLTDCSGIDINDDAKCYYVLFNQHDVAECNPGDGKYKYKIEAITANGADDEDDDSDEPADGELTPAQIMKYIADGIKSGAIRSKSGEGYFVLKGEYYDAIEAGRKTTEYRDLTPRNLSLSIGIKTVKFQRGYGHPGKPPRQMRYEVSSVRLMDAEDRECDPYAIPPGFIAATIAIHLGKRIG